MRLRHCSHVLQAHMAALLALRGGVRGSVRAEFRLQRRQRHAGEVGGPTLPHARTKIYPQRVDGGALARWTPNSRGELATTVDKRGRGRAGRSQSSGCDVDGDGLGSPEAGGCSGDLAMVPGEVRRRGREGKGDGEASVRCAGDVICGRMGGR